MLRATKNYMVDSLFERITRSVSPLCTVILLLLISSCATVPNIDAVKRAEVHNKIALSYLNNNQLNEAHVELQKALKLNPENAETLNYLGYVSSRYGKMEDAISYYKRAVSIDPGYADAINNLGVVYAEMKEWDQAIANFKSALVNPLYHSPAYAYSNMGFAYYKKADYTNAEKALNEAILRNPVFPQALYILGLVYVDTENDAAAISSFKDAIGVLPDYLDAHWELGNAYLRSGQSKNALIHLKIVAENEKNTERSVEAAEYIKLFK